MMLDLSPKRTYIDCSGDGHIIDQEIENSNKPNTKTLSETFPMQG